MDTNIYPSDVCAEKIPSLAWGAEGGHSKGCLPDRLGALFLLIYFFFLVTIQNGKVNC